MKILKKLLLYGFILYSIVGFFVVPYILKSKIIELVPQYTNAKIDIQSIYFNPYIFKLKLSDIKLSSKTDKELISFKSILLNLEVYSLFNTSFHLKNFILEEPKISVVYNKDKTINLLKILKENTQVDKKENKNEPSELFRIILDRVAIIDGTVKYEDYTRKTKFDFSFNEIGFELKNIDTNDFNSSDGSLRFYTLLEDGGFIDLKTEVVGFKPFKIKGSLGFEASKLYTQWRYMRDELNLEVADGKLSFFTNYYFNMDNLDETSIDGMNVNLEKLRIKPKDEFRDVLNLDTLYAKNISIKPMLQDVKVEDFGLSGLYVKASRDKAGKIDWLEYIKRNTQETKEVVVQQESNASKKSARAWNVLVDRIALEKMKLDFNDKGIRPNVDTNINELNIHMQNVSLLGEKPFNYDIDLRVNDDFVCSSRGSVAHKIVAIKSHTNCKNFDIVHYRPYIDDIAKKSLKKYDVKLKSAVSSFDTTVDVSDLNGTMVIDLKDTSFNLSKLQIDKKSTRENIFNVKSFNIGGVDLNTKTKEINIKNANINGSTIKVAKYSNGVLNFKDIVVAKKSKKKKSSKKNEPYHIKLNNFAINEAKVNFVDSNLTKKTKTTLDRIYLRASKIDSKTYSWLNYKLSMRLNKKGYIKSRGKVRHTPLRQDGNLELKNISLKEFNPYIQEKAFVRIGDGRVNLKSRVRYAKSRKYPDLRVNGKFSIKEFFLNDSRDHSSLISFSEVKLKSFDFEMFPNRLYIDDVDVNSFYVNAIVDENKVMNFATLSKSVKTQDTNETVTQNESPKDKNATQKENNFPVKIMKLNVLNGSANFADYSLPIRFETSIHDLEGVTYAISNEPDEVSYIEMNGAIDKYGSTKLKGSLNSSNPKSYTDLDFNFRNLEMNSFSGYSASFAGYKIDSGKLFLNLEYKIFDSDLLGNNSIIIKNVELGEEVEDENITKLPLGFVFGLLEDSDGIIDIKMPVEGNVDEPDFKYGALVWKTLGGLVVKAVSSPFRFLGSMMGMDGDDLEDIEFEPGLANIVPSEKEKLDIIADMFIKRPKISLEISGSFNETIDKFALQKEKLATIVMQKSGSKNQEEGESAMTVSILEDIYDENKGDDKLERIKDELETRYEDEVLERKYLQEALKETISVMELQAQELKDLATKRANILKQYLVNEKGILESRISFSEISNVDSDDEKWVKTGLKIDVK